MSTMEAAIRTAHGNVARHFLLRRPIWGESCASVPVPHCPHATNAGAPSAQRWGGNGSDSAKRGEPAAVRGHAPVDAVGAGGTGRDRRARVAVPGRAERTSAPDSYPAAGAVWRPDHDVAGDRAGARAVSRGGDHLDGGAGLRRVRAAMGRGGRGLDAGGLVADGAGARTPL